MVFPPRNIVQSVKKEYPSGTRVELVSMNDPYRDMPTGTRGTVDCVDDTGTIHVAWDNGCHLGVVYGEDSCRKLHTIRTICYGKEETWDCKEDAVAFFLQAVAGSEGAECERYTITGVYLCPVVVFQFMCFRVIYVLPKGKQAKKEYIE